MISPSTVATKTPMAARILAASLLSVVSIGTPAMAQRVTESEVAERARQRVLHALAPELRAARARAAAEVAAPHPNPVLEYERQQAFDNNAQTQDLLWLRVPLDFSGRRRADRALARLDAVDAEAEAALARTEAVTEALRLFYRTLAAERRVAVLEEAQTALDEGARVARSREEAGHGSGYVTARLALEASLGRSTVEQARLERDALRVRLLGWLGLADGTTLAGNFDVEAPDGAVDPSGRPEAQAVAALNEEAAAAGRAARSSWVPRLEVSGAYNRQSQPGAVGQGYGVGLGVELPISDRGQRQRAEAAAAAEVAERYAATVDDTLGAELRAARARLMGLLRERERLTASLGDTEVLVQAAEAGFREGERSLVELLDARRAALAAQDRLLTLDLAVRMADVEYRRTTGELR